MHMYTYTHKLMRALAQYVQTISDTLQDCFLSITCLTGISSLTCLLFQGSMHISQNADTSLFFFFFFSEAALIQLFLHDKLVVRGIFLLIQINGSDYHCNSFQMTKITLIASLRTLKKTPPFNTYIGTNKQKIQIPINQIFHILIVVQQYRTDSEK